MSNSATFELKTEISQQSILKKLESLWNGHGRFVDVYTYPDYGAAVFCNLQYIHNLPDEEDAIRRIVNFLIEISYERKIFYYRCSDFAPLRGGYIPVLEITLDNLFQEEFSPSLNDSIEAKYLLSH